MRGCGGLSGSVAVSYIPMPRRSIWKLIVAVGHTVLSTGDSGNARLWKQTYDGKWAEFADFGPEE